MGPRRRGGPHLTSEIIYERERGRRKGGRERGGTRSSRGGQNRWIVFFSLPLGSHIVRRERERSIKIISGALMRNYERLVVVPYFQRVTGGVPAPLRSVKGVFYRLYFKFLEQSSAERSASGQRSSSTFVEECAGSVPAGCKAPFAAFAPNSPHGCARLCVLKRSKPGRSRSYLRNGNG